MNTSSGESNLQRENKRLAQLKKVADSLPDDVGGAKDDPGDRQTELSRAEREALKESGEKVDQGREEEEAQGKPGEEKEK